MPSNISYIIFLNITILDIEKISLIILADTIIYSRKKTSYMVYINIIMLYWKKSCCYEIYWYYCTRYKKDWPYNVD